MWCGGGKGGRRRGGGGGAARENGREERARAEGRGRRGPSGGDPSRRTRSWGRPGCAWGGCGVAVPRRAPVVWVRRGWGRARIRNAVGLAAVPPAATAVVLVAGPAPPLRPPGRRRASGVRTRPSLPAGDPGLSPCRGGSRRGRVARGAAPRGRVPRRRPAGRRGAARRCALPPGLRPRRAACPEPAVGRSIRGRRGVRGRAPRRPSPGPEPCGGARGVVCVCVRVWERGGWRAVGVGLGWGRGPAVGGDRRASAARPPAPPLVPVPPPLPARVGAPRSPPALVRPSVRRPAPPAPSKPGRAPPPARAAGSCSPPAGPRRRPCGRRPWPSRAGVLRRPVPLSFPSPGLAPLAPRPLPGGAPSETRPQIRRGDPLNLSILVSGGKETNQDSLSNGE